METIEDIVREMRTMGENYSISESNDCRYVAYWLGTTFADRIEAAVKNQFRDTTKTMPEVAVAENATTTPTRDKSSQVGNAAEMYEALKAVVKVGYPHNFQHEAPHIRGYCYEITTAIDKCFAALAAPPRNCDVGTEIDQRKRYAEMCQYNCDMCSLQHKRALKGGCELAWAQMPYEKEGEA
jgi:hypothetical protein